MQFDDVDALKLVKSTGFKLSDYQYDREYTC